MKVRIKHETTAVLVFLLIAVMLFFLLFTLYFMAVPLWVLIIDLAAAVTALLFYIIELVVGTSIITDDRSVTIQRPFTKKKIALEDICGLDIENYHRIRHGSSHYTEYRMRMTISERNGNITVLNDQATAFNGAKGFVLSVSDRLPDHQVPLYRAYTIINKKLQ